MQRTADITDRAALDRNRRRARAAGESAMFLQEEAATELHERLQLVNRRFTAPAVVSAWPRLWSARFPSAKMVGDTDTLDLAPGAHDLVIHAMGLHWSGDPVGQLIQCRRALRPDGLFLGVLFGGQTLTELRTVLAESEIDETGGISPRILPMAEIRDLGGLLQRAGFALPVADSLRHTVTYDTAFHLMRDLRAMGEANAMAARIRRFSRRDLFLRAVDRYQSVYGQRDGRVPASFELIFLIGWAPDDSQPKPLRPGSAGARLADALGVAEKPLKSRA